MGNRTSMFPNYHDENSHGQADGVHCLPQIRPNLRQPAGGDLDQDRGRDGGDDIQGGGVHHQAGSHGRYILHHQQGQGNKQFFNQFYFRF